MRIASVILGVATLLTGCGANGAGAMAGRALTPVYEEPYYGFSGCTGPIVPEALPLSGGPPVIAIVRQYTGCDAAPFEPSMGLYHQVEGGWSLFFAGPYNAVSNSVDRGGRNASTRLVPEADGNSASVRVTGGIVEIIGPDGVVLASTPRDASP